MTGKEWVRYEVVHELLNNQISEFVNDILNYLNSQFIDKKSIDYQYWERRKEIWEKIGK